MKKMVAFLLLLSIWLQLPSSIEAAVTTPYEVPKLVENQKFSILGGREVEMTLGKTLVYDVYSHKFTPGGYKVVEKDFGKGKQPYLNFQGWSILFGHKRHTANNHKTYIVAQNLSTAETRTYSTLPKNLSATFEVAYNTKGNVLWNECPAGSVNKHNATDCNMQYDNVGFDAYLPLNDLFPDLTKNDEWNLFIVKEIEGKVVYSPLVLPFSFDKKTFGKGEIDLTSGLDANKLDMIGYPVIRRQHARQTGVFGSTLGYFKKFATYTRVNSDEKGTSVWYGVQDGNSVRWASSSYWAFGGKQAVIKYQVLEPEIIDPGPPVIIPPPNAECPFDATTSKGESMVNTDTTHPITGQIVESIESKEFDVLKYGIPSSEYLKLTGETEKYLANYKYQKILGKLTYDITVRKNFIYKWEVKSTNEYGRPVITVNYDVKLKTQKVKDPYDISFWLIDNFSLSDLDNIKVENYALSNPQNLLINNTKTDANANHNPKINDHIKTAKCNDVYLGQTIINGKPPVGGPTEDISKGVDVGNRAPNVVNDFAEVDGFVSLSDKLSKQHAPKPKLIPTAPKITLEQSSLQIDETKANRWETPSKIIGKYKNILHINTEAKDLELVGQSPKDINTVTVHTPVIMYGQSTDDKENDQRIDPPQRSTPTNPDTDTHALILDKPFTIKLGNNGQHLSTDVAPGYGKRSYEKYVRKENGKQVKFPFDVYTESKQGFYPKNTWITVPTNMEEVTFELPVWVPEGEYDVKFRSIAINSPQSIEEEQQEEKHANLNLQYRTPNEVMEKHIAVSTIKVDVIGRLYDFRVTDILDFRWGPVFRTTEGLIEHTGNYYWVGDKMINGELRGNQEPFELPVRHGSHPKSPEEMKNVAVKTGYQFKFDMKSKGSMWNHDDAIRITPSFHFVNKDGTDRRAVNIYYHDEANYFVQIGSDKDKQYREVTLNEPLRNVEEKQLYDTADFMYRNPDEFGYRDTADKVSKASFIRKFNRDYSKQKTVTGPYGWQMLNSNLRTLIGPDATDVPNNAMVSPEDAVASEQQWFGEYSLPAEIFVTDVGRNIAGYGAEHRLTKKSPVFLQDGYVIVNFDIETIDKGDIKNPRLSYHKGELSNQWNKEGFKYSFTDPYGDNFNLIDGDVIFYHGDQSSYDDFGSNVTH